MSNFFQNVEMPVNLLNEQAFAANQRGQITPEQQKEFSSISWMRVVGLVFVIALLGCVLGLGIFSLVGWAGTRSLGNILLSLLFALIFLAVSFSIAYSILQPIRRRAVIQRDYENGGMRQGEGQLVYGKKGYSFDLGNGMTTLPLPANQSNGLVPGTIYQVYYFEGSGYLLSAKAARPANPTQVASALNDILAMVNRFSAEDLLANCQGQVTTGQRAKLIPNLFMGIFIIALGVLFFVPFGMTFASSRNTLTMLLLTAFFVIFPVIGLFIIFKALSEMAFPTLKSLDGVGFKGQRVVHTGKSSYVEYFYTIQGQRFVVNHRAHTALVDGLNYRIYYLPRSKKMLSIEVFNNANSSF